MGKGRHKLKPLQVERMKKPGRYGDGHGLYLVVRKSGSKAWSYVWIRQGVRREMGLGGFPGVDLIRARDRANIVRAQVADGLDPIVERDKDVTKKFSEVAELVLAKKRKTWTNAKHGDQWERALNVLCKPLHSVLVNEIDTPHVLRVLNPVWEKTPETGRRLRSRLAHVLDYATTQGWRTGENPARWKGHLEHVLENQTAKRKNFPAMPYSELPAFMELLREKNTLPAMALELTILTAARTGETLGAKWSEIDLENALWSIPASRMKMKVGHDVPLSPRAVELLAKLGADRFSEYVFPGQRPIKPLSNMAMTMVLRRMDLGHYTVHGFRSTFRTWCGDKTNFPREIAEQALSHRIGNAIEQAYSRGKALEKRRRLMDSWADYCGRAQSSEVVRLHG